MLARHVSILIGPSSGAFYKLYLQIWYVVIRVLSRTKSANTAHLTGPPSGAFYKLYVQIWYVVIRLLPRNKSAHTACKKRS